MRDLELGYKKQHLSFYKPCIQVKTNISSMEKIL